jgi:hypothetical protein
VFSAFIRKIRIEEGALNAVFYNSGGVALKNAYKVVALIGAIMWGATVFLRDTFLMDNLFIKQFLWVAPNLSAVWVGVGLPIVYYEHFAKKQFNFKYIYTLVGMCLVILLASELIHPLYSDSQFDIWDMAASLLAGVVVIIVHVIGKRYCSNSKQEVFKE